MILQELHLHAARGATVTVRITGTQPVWVTRSSKPTPLKEWNTISEVCVYF